MRWEYDTALRDPQRRLSRFMDFSQGLPALEAAAKPLPQQALDLRSTPLSYTGAWIFTDDDNPGMWDAPKNNFLPRAGLGKLQRGEIVERPPVSSKAPTQK